MHNSEKEHRWVGAASAWETCTHSLCMMYGMCIKSTCKMLLLRIFWIGWVADKCSGLVLHFFLFSRQGAALCSALGSAYIYTYKWIAITYKKKSIDLSHKNINKFQNFSSCGLIFYHSKFSHVAFSQIELSVYVCMYVCMY